MGLSIIAGWMSLTADVQAGVRLGGVAVGLGVGVVAPFLLGVRHQIDTSAVLAFPVLLSATQNLLLLPIAPLTSDQHIAILLSINLLAAALLAVMAAWSERTGVVRAWRTWPPSGIAALVVVLLVGVSAFMSLTVREVSPAAVLASTRNLLSVPAFLILGILATRAASVARYCGCLVALCWGVVLFGLFERFHPSFWQDAGLGDLWEKKGIIVETYGLPMNFMSSEQIDGEQLRRMASSFADPVNLGTFLVLAFLAAWYLRRWFSAALALMGCVLAISKAALVGVLVFCLVAAWFSLPRRAQGAVAALCALVAGAFLIYSWRSSTGSVFVHVGGLAAAISELPEAPLGHGVGRSGNLADMLSGSGPRPSSVVESGLGAIIGQLGLPGLLAFATLFAAVALGFRVVHDRRRAILGWSILLAFVVNSMFNEVALSPNSSAAYFTILGLMVGHTSTPVTERPVSPHSVTGRHRGSAAFAVLLMLAGAVLSCATTWPSKLTYQANLEARIVTQHFVWTIDEEGDPVHRWQPFSQELQRLEAAREYGYIATLSPITSETSYLTRMIAGSEVLARGDVGVVPTPARLRFTASHETPDQATALVRAWAETTARAVARQERSARPFSELRLYNGLQVGQVNVVERQTAALTYARHVILGLATGAGLALAWWLLWSSSRSRPGRPGRPRA